MPFRGEVKKNRVVTTSNRSLDERNVSSFQMMRRERLEWASFTRGVLPGECRSKPLRQRSGRQPGDPDPRTRRREPGRDGLSSRAGPRSAIGSSARDRPQSATRRRTPCPAGLTHPMPSVLCDPVSRNSSTDAPFVNAADCAHPSYCPGRPTSTASPRGAPVEPIRCAYIDSPLIRHAGVGVALVDDGEIVGAEHLRRTQRGSS